MLEGKRSRTAEIAALQRAMHLVQDKAPFVFVDDKVAPLLSPGLRLLLHAPTTAARYFSSMMQSGAAHASQMRGQIVVRSRYTEDQLQRQLDRGLDQYVILSAGLDTFALRRTDLQQQLAVFEIDQPDTQKWKFSLIGAGMPESLHFIPIDFERESLADVLHASQFDSSRTAFFSWLGTTYYLSRKAIVSTLGTILSTAASGSELVLDYWSELPASNWFANALLSSVRWSVAWQGEPMLSFFKPEDIEREVKNLGFEVLENFTPDNARQNYLNNRPDRLDVPDFAYLLHLRVP